MAKIKINIEQGIFYECQYAAVKWSLGRVIARTAVSRWSGWKSN